MDSNDVKDAAREVGDHRAVETLARVGYGASGLLHLVMGYIALKVAWSGSGEKADQSGALALLAGNTAGRLLLWVLVVGFWGLALWQLTEAIVGRGETSDRAKAAAKFVMYLTLGWAAFGFARGQGNSSSDQTQGFTAELMSHTGGQLLVGAIGLAVIGVGIYHVHKGWSQKFLRHLVEHPGRWATIAGRVGYIAKGRPSTRTAPRPAASTVRCAPCATNPSGSGCSPSSPSGWRPTASTPSRALGTPRSDPFVTRPPPGPRGEARWGHEDRGQDIHRHRRRQRHRA
jgi:hypothetical protein